MVSTSFNGMLGNNLFQAAAIISIAQDLQEDFILPEKSWAGHRGLRDSDLSIFGYQFLRGDHQFETEYHEKNFFYEEIPAQRGMRINGFFQSWKYFDKNRDVLLNKYFIPSERVSSRLDQIDISENSLGICVRRGDYLMLQNNHCVLSVEYYQNSINKHFSEVDQVFVFSDDYDWCRQVFGDSVNYVDESVGVQLFLMSKLPNLLLANSTFSWWGAYLNQRNPKVIAPSPWFGPGNSHINTADLYYPNWNIEHHTIEQQPYSITENMYKDFR